MAEYKFPVWGTQGGGLVREEGDHYVFVEAPEGFPDIKVGDRMHEMWDLAPANEAAREGEIVARMDYELMWGTPGSWD